MIFARWVAERGSLRNVRNFGWYNRGVTEPIAYTIARCGLPELLEQMPGSESHFTLVPQALSTSEARAEYIARRVQRPIKILEFQLNRNSTFLEW